MQKHACMLFVFISLMAAVCNCVFADNEPQAYVIDPAASKILFTAQSTLHPVEGTAGTFSGEFAVSTVEKGFNASGDVIVEIESLVTDNKALNRNMYRMFESKVYPQSLCRIESAEVSFAEAGKPGTGKLKAVLTIRKISQPFECDVTAESGQGTVTLKGSTSLSLKEFALKPPTILGIIKMQDAVVVNFDVTLKERKGR